MRAFENKSRSRMWVRWLILAGVICIIYLVAGCAPTPEIRTRVVTVPSSAPYRYIKPHPEDKLTNGTLAQISRHNSAHYLVKKKEAEANAKSND